MASAHWTASGDTLSGIGRYEYALGTVAGTTDVRGWTNNYLATAITATGLSLTDGQQVFTGVRAYNGAGLFTEAWSDGFFIDTQAPEIVTANPADSEHLGSSTPTIILNLLDEGSGINPGTLTYLLDFAPVDPSSFEVCFGSTVYHGATVTGGATCGENLRITHPVAEPLSESSHVITLSLADQLGNSMSQSIVFYVDDPSVLRISPPVAELLPGETVTFTASGGRGSYDWSASGGAPAMGNGSSFLFTAGANPGIYTVSVSDDSGASKSVPVTIHGEMEIDPPLANLAMGEQQVFNVIGGTPPYTWDATGGTLSSSTGGSVTYTAGMQTGAFEVSVLDSATDQHSFSARVNITQFVGRAIIVAGGGPKDSQWDKNEAMAKRVFQTLVHRGFTGDKIYFLSNDYQEYWDGDFNGVSDIRPALPTESALQAAFDWAQPQVNANVSLTVYLIDHGGPGAFQMTADKAAADADERILTPPELKSMLDGIQAATDCRVIVIIEACHSGSFSGGLANPAYNRKLLMSSRADQLSFLSPEPFFSLYFWSAVKNGFDLKESFNESWSALFNSQWKGHQQSQADGDGDGVMGPIGTELLSGIFIGTDVGTLGSFPEITAVSPDQVLSSVTAETGATVWAQVESVETMAEVYALIVPPGFSPPSPQDAGTTDGNIVDTPVIDFVKVSFVNTHDQVWEGRYNGFIANGTYTMVLYARDAAGQTSLPAETRVTTSQPYLNGEYPARDSVGQAQNVRMQFHVMDAEDGVDLASLQVWVEGIDVTAACVVSGTPYDYFVRYDPDPVFGILDSVTVEIFASDYYGNEMVHVVSGETMAAGDIIHFTTTDAVDNDVDGLPDDWELYFNVATASGDDDLDGASNLVEFQAGTNPRGADSTPISADSFEDDDLVSWSSSIVVGGTEQAHNLHDAGDVDWIKFTGVEGLAYQVEVYEVGGIIDPVLDVYDAGLNSLAHADDGGLGEDETAVIAPLADTNVIFIKVRGLDPLAYGVGAEYKLRVTIPGNPFGALFGKITKPNGDGIQNAAVELIADISLGSVSTNANGKYTRLGVPAGTYTVRVSKSGYYTRVESGVVINDGMTRELNLTLTVVSTTATLMGVVRDQDTGDPAPDATVYSIFSGRVYLDTTDNAGVYVIPGLAVGPGNNYVFNVIHPDYEPTTQIIPVTVAGNIAADFSIARIILDSDGDGILDVDETGIYSTNPNDRDTDGDGINDYLEAITVACLDPLDPDTDNDGLMDGVEDGNTNGTVDIGESSPCEPDTDHDGLADGLEGNTLGSSPLSWDTDHDGLPDKFEYDNRAAGPPLDLLNASDGGSDFDSDLNPNVHEYYNGSPLWTADPNGHQDNEQYGCAYWGDATGECIIDPIDLSVLQDRLLGLPVSYALVIPPSGETHDLDGDGLMGPGDFSLLQDLTLFLPMSSIGTSPVSLAVESSPVSPVQVGDTTHVTIGVNNQAASQTPGFAVEFWIDGSSTGTATLFGGDGHAAGVRYDISGPTVAGSSSTIVVRVDTPGDIYIRARIVPCGIPGTGRNTAGLTLGSPVLIQGTP